MNNVDIYEYLSKRLFCNFESGELFWLENPLQKRNWNERMVGTKAGNLSPKGYIRIKVWFFGKVRIVLAHRLIFYMKYGYLPIQVDHKDRVRSNNSISNLRDANEEKNSYNKNLSSLNTSGYKGVCWNKASRKWVARIGFKNNRILVGRFDDIEEANEALQKVRFKLHGEFATNGIKEQ